VKKIGYVSDTTTFLRDFLESHPQVREQQKKNRATWWDKPQDLATSKERADAAVPQPGYVYFPLPRKES
jgi:uncharacterized protein DUF3460